MRNWLEKFLSLILVKLLMVIMLRSRTWKIKYLVVTTATLTTVKSKIPDVSTLVKMQIMMQKY